MLAWVNTAGPHDDKLPSELFTCLLAIIVLPGVSDMRQRKVKTMCILQPSLGGLSHMFSFQKQPFCCVHHPLNTSGCKQRCECQEVS